MGFCVVRKGQQSLDLSEVVSIVFGGSWKSADGMSVCRWGLEKVGTEAGVMRNKSRILTERSAEYSSHCQYWSIL